VSIEIVSPKRVLLAEPHDETRLQYRSLFGHAGYDVVDTSDGRDALAKALVRVPSIVVTALELPGLDGLALCEILRQDRVTTRVPILVLAAKIKSVELDRARRLADAVLLTPSSPEAVVARAQSLIARAAVTHAQSATLRSRSSDWQARAAQLRERSHELDSRGAAQRASLRERHRRFETSHPPLAPPRLRCPVCDGALSYLRSYVGGVNERSSEQWDDYECPACGAFQYRHRTRKLRRLDLSPPRT
jgi:DNA-binding response OmpR family regulator